MLTISIVRSGLHYVIDAMSFRDIGVLFIHLRAEGVTPENLLKAAEGLARDGRAAPGRQVLGVALRCYLAVSLS